jgi:hypothetical protein
VLVLPGGDLGIAAEQADLDEARSIAERGAARAHVAVAPRLVDETSYRRREGALAGLEGKVESGE